MKKLVLLLFLLSTVHCFAQDAANTPTAGSFYYTNVTSNTSLSDARDKADIEDLTLGLDFLCTLKPRQFHWNKREWYDKKIWVQELTSYETFKGDNDGSKKEDNWSAGFIAQELDAAENNAGAEWLNLVYKNDPDKWEAAYGKLLPVIVKSIQELKEQNDELTSENIKLKEQVAQLGDLTKQIAEIKQLKLELTEQLRIVKANNDDTNTATVAYTGK